MSYCAVYIDVAEILKNKLMSSKSTYHVRLRDATNKEAVYELARELCRTPEGMRTLVALLADEDLTTVKRAAWVFNHGGAFYPQHIPDVTERLFPIVDRSVHPSVRRGIVSVWQHSDPHEAQLGGVVHRCFGYLADPNEHAAVRAFSCDVLWRACLREPDLMTELKETAEMVIPHAKPALRYRASRALQRIARYRKQQKL